MFIMGAKLGLCSALLCSLEVSGYRVLRTILALRKDEIRIMYELRNL
jgi:hypothetical protein